MDLETSFAIYLIIWWIVLFSILPVGVVSHAEAGIKAPGLLSGLGGLETNRVNQLVVKPTLQTTRDDAIFAIGDCAACPWEGHPGGQVPPRAQAAHQQATHLLRQIRRRLSGASARRRRSEASAAASRRSPPSA